MKETSLRVLAEGGPRPRVRPETRGYWEGCAQRELRVQKCEECSRCQFPPAPVCIFCGGDVEWIDVGKRGVIFSWTTIHEDAGSLLHPAHRDRTPYVIVLVDFDSAPGVHLPGSLALENIEQVDVLDEGLAVDVDFVELDEVTHPYFILANP